MRRPLPYTYWYLMLGVIAFILFFGIWGVYEQNHNIWNAFYSTIQMFTNETNDFNVDDWRILLARFMAAGLFGAAVFYGLWFLIKKDWQQYIKAKYSKDHTLIIGLGNIGYLLAKEILKGGGSMIVIESNENNDNISELKKENKRAFIIIQDVFNNPELLIRVSKKAERIIISTGDDDKNIEVVNVLAQHTYDRNIICFVHIDKISKSEVFKDNLQPISLNDNLNISAFSITQSAAQYIYDKFRPDLTLEKYDKDFAIAMIGFNQTAEFFILENFILSHFPGIKQTIFLITKDSDQIRKYLDFKYPYLDRYLDVIPVELVDEHFYKNPLNISENKETEKRIALKKSISMFYVFGEDDSTVINQSMALRQLLFVENGDIRNIPIVACLPEKSDIYQLIENNFSLRHKNNADNPLMTLKEYLKDEFNINIVLTYKDICTKSRFIDENDLTDILARIINFYYYVSYSLGGWLKKEHPEKEEITENEAIDSAIDHIITQIRKEFLNLSNTLVNTREPLKQIEEVLLASLLEKLKAKGISYPENLSEKFSIEFQWDSISDRIKDSNRYAARHHAIKVKSQAQTDDFKNIAYIEHDRWCAEKLVFRYRYGAYPQGINEEERKALKSLLKDELKIHNLLVEASKLGNQVKKDYDVFELAGVLNQVIKCLNPPVV
jgi:Trk K+ transport system NAD-binding subunit